MGTPCWTKVGVQMETRSPISIQEKYGFGGHATAGARAETAPWEGSQVWVLEPSALAKPEQDGERRRRDQDGSNQILVGFQPTLFGRSRRQKAGEKRGRPQRSRDRVPGSYPPAGKLRNLRTERVLPRRESRRRCIARSGRGRPAGFRGCHVLRQAVGIAVGVGNGLLGAFGAGGRANRASARNPASPKEITISARRAASAWSRAVWTISPRRSNAAISRSSKACGFPDRSSKTPITSCSRGRGITSADTMPNAWQISRLTR